MSARKIWTRCSASFSYSLLASKTSFLRMSLLRATTLEADRHENREARNYLIAIPDFECCAVAVIRIALCSRYLGDKSLLSLESITGNLLLTNDHGSKSYVSYLLE